MRALAALLGLAGCAEGHRWDLATTDPDASSPADAAEIHDAVMEMHDAVMEFDAGGNDAASAYPPLDFEPVGGDLGGLAAYLHVPAGIPVGSQPPLIVVLHGCWESASVHEANAGWDSLADAHGWIVLHVEEIEDAQQCLDWWGHTDDAGVLAAIEIVDSVMEIDDGVIYLDGFGAGAGAAVGLLVAEPERFAGAILHAPRAYGASIPAGHHAPIVVFIGGADQTVAPAMSEQLVGQWTQAAGVDHVPDQTGAVHDAPLEVFRDDDGGLVAATVTIAGMGHGYAVDPDGEGGGTSGHLGSHPAYGLDVGLWSSYWGAKLLDIVE